MTPTELKALRQSLGLTQEQLATKLRVQRNTVNRWEMGIRAISPMAALLLSKLKPQRRSAS